MNLFFLQKKRENKLLSCLLKAFILVCFTIFSSNNLQAQRTSIANVKTAFYTGNSRLPKSSEITDAYNRFLERFKRCSVSSWEKVHLPWETDPLASNQVVIPAIQCRTEPGVSVAVLKYDYSNDRFRFDRVFLQNVMRSFSGKSDTGSYLIEDDLTYLAPGWISGNAPKYNANNGNVPASNPYETDEDDEDDGTGMAVVIGALTAAAIAGFIRKRKKNKSKNTRKKKAKDEQAEYVLQINKEQFVLNTNQPQLIEAKVWKITKKGKQVVQAHFQLNCTEKALKITPNSASGTLKSQLQLTQMPQQYEFYIHLSANAGGHTAQKNIKIITEKGKIIIKTEPDNRRTIRPNVQDTLTVYAKVVDGTDKDIDELSKLIQFDGTQSEWIDLSEPVWQDGWIAINMQASDPDANAAVSHPPKSVTLGVSLEYNENNKHLKLDETLKIGLLDCKLDTNLDEVSFPVSDQQSEITFEAHIEDCEDIKTWKFDAVYMKDYENIDPKPPTLINIEPVSDSKVNITLTGPIEKPKEDEQFIRKLLVVSAQQKNEKALERHIYVTVSKEGLFLERGNSQTDEISIEAKGEVEKDFEMALYVYDKKTDQIVVDKIGLQNLQFELIAKEETTKNIMNVLKPSFTFKDFVTTIPFGKYTLEVPNAFPGFGNYHFFRYRVTLLDAEYEESLKFQKIITLKIKDYGVGEDYPEWQKAYEDCKHTIYKYVPNTDKRRQMIDLLEKKKYEFDVEGMVAYRNMVWNYARNMMINERDGYLSDANWYDAYINTLEWVEWMGDIAFQVVLASTTGYGVGLAASAFKQTFLTGVKIIIDGKSADDFVHKEIAAIKEMIYSTAKGRVVSTQTIEKFYHGNKLKVWAIYAVVTFGVQLNRYRSIPKAAKETARQLRDEAIITFLHGKVKAQQDKIAAERKPTDTEGYEASHEPPDVSGYTSSSMKAIQRIANKFNVKIITRPTNAAARALIKTGQAVPKKMFVKNKTINKLDTYIGASKKNVGMVGSFKPKLNRAKLRKLPKKIRREVIERYRQRRKEFHDQAQHLKEYKDKLYVEDGVVYDAKSKKPFTGDIDVYDIVDIHGKKISTRKYNKVVKALQRSGTNVEHGAHLRWKWWEHGNREARKTNKGIYNKIVKSHKKTVVTKEGKIKKGEALVEYRPMSSGGVRIRGIFHN